MIYLWWLGAALVFVLIEVLVVDLTFLMLGIGALAASLFSWFKPESLWGQVIIFAVVSIACLFALKPWVKTHLTKRSPNLLTNAAGLVGEPAIVTESVNHDAGYVRINGQIWSAKTTQQAAIEAGTRVYVTRIDGATAIVTTESVINTK